MWLPLKLGKSLLQNPGPPCLQGGLVFWDAKQRVCAVRVLVKGLGLMLSREERSSARADENAAHFAWEGASKAYRLKPQVPGARALSPCTRSGRWLSFPARPQLTDLPSVSLREIDGFPFHHIEIPASGLGYVPQSPQARLSPVAAVEQQEDTPAFIPDDARNFVFVHNLALNEKPAETEQKGIHGICFFDEKDNACCLYEFVAEDHADDGKGRQILFEVRLTFDSAPQLVRSPSACGMQGPIPLQTKLHDELEERERINDCSETSDDILREMGLTFFSELCPQSRLVGLCWLTSADNTTLGQHQRLADSRVQVGSLGALALLFEDKTLDCFFHLRPPPLQRLPPLCLAELKLEVRQQLCLRMSDLHNPSGGSYFIDCDSDLLKVSAAALWIGMHLLTLLLARSGCRQD